MMTKQKINMRVMAELILGIKSEKLSFKEMGKLTQKINSSNVKVLNRLILEV